MCSCLFSFLKMINISKFMFKFKCILQSKLIYNYLIIIDCLGKGVGHFNDRNEKTTILTDVQKESPKVREYVCCLYKAESFQFHLSIVKKKFFFFSKLCHCQYWFSFSSKTLHKTVWCTKHGVFESRTNMKKYKMHTLQVFFLIRFHLFCSFS